MKWNPTFDSSPGWRRLAGRFAIPDKVEELSKVRIKRDEALQMIEGVHEIE